MPDIANISDFLDPISPATISQDEGYHDGQIGNAIITQESPGADFTEADIIFIGSDEHRGGGPGRRPGGADIIRREFYKLYNWHPLRLADAGNVRTGASLADSSAALRTVIREISAAGKTVVVLGGSHDLTLAQYHAFADEKKMIEVSCVDARIDLDMNSMARQDNFLMEMLTGEPNFIRHYNHIGFQSYLVHPGMLETLDKLRFDCFRVGKVREQIEEMEPVIRHSNLISFDISAIANAYAPANTITPNGLTGEDACALMRYAGMSPEASSVGIYGYQPHKDRDSATAMQIAQMLWYFLEGRSKGKRDASVKDKEAFNEFHIAFGEIETTFLQSKRTGRWWMQLPDQQFIACSYNDYIAASSNEIPERWLRAQERSA